MGFLTVFIVLLGSNSLRNPIVKNIPCTKMGLTFSKMTFLTNSFFLRKTDIILNKCFIFFRHCPSFHFFPSIWNLEPRFANLACVLKEPDSIETYIMLNWMSPWTSHGENDFIYPIIILYKNTIEKMSMKEIILNNWRGINEFWNNSIDCAWTVICFF